MWFVATGLYPAIRGSIPRGCTTSPPVLKKYGKSKFLETSYRERRPREDVQRKSSRFKRLDASGADKIGLAKRRAQTSRI